LNIIVSFWAETVYFVAHHKSKIIERKVIKFGTHIDLEAPCSVIDFWSRRSETNITRLWNECCLCLTSETFIRWCDCMLLITYAVCYWILGVIYLLNTAVDGHG